MSAVLDGLDDLLAQLKRLPEDLYAEGRTIVSGHAKRAYQRTFSAYPPSGPPRTFKGRSRPSLRDGLGLVDNSGNLSAAWHLYNEAPHARIWESGSQVGRETQKGYNRGIMPKAPHGLISFAIAERRQMYDELLAMVRRAGLDVDDAATR